MARKKVSLTWIANDATRRATFRKRRKGLMKKVQELSTLCDVDACVVVYGEGEKQPEVWPPAAGEAAAVLERFRAMPALEQCKKMMDQEGFLRQRITKLHEQLAKAQRENREREMDLLLLEALVGRRPGLEGLTIEEVTSLGWVVEMRLRRVRDRISRLRRQGPQGALPAPPPLPPPSTLTTPAASSTQPRAPVNPYVNGNRNTTTASAMDRALIQQGWLLDVARTGGDLGALVYSGFASGAGDAGCGTTNAAAGLADMLGDAGFIWPDPRTTSFPPM